MIISISISIWYFVSMFLIGVNLAFFEGDLSYGKDWYKLIFVERLMWIAWCLIKITAWSYLWPIWLAIFAIKRTFNRKVKVNYES